MKKLLRKKLLIIRNSIPLLDQINLSEKITQNVISTEEWKKSKTIMLYISINSEVMTLKLLSNAVEENKRIVLPKVVRNNIIPITLNKNFKLLSGYMGILEPIEGEEFEGLIDLAIIPLVGFDLQGYRIGYGGGFYDRFLKEYESKIKIKIGIAYELQKIQNIPYEEHDIKLDYVITEKQIYSFV